MVLYLYCVTTYTKSIFSLRQHGMLLLLVGQCSPVGRTLTYIMDKGRNLLWWRIAGVERCFLFVNDQAFPEGQPTRSHLGCECGIWREIHRGLLVRPH